MSLDEAVAFALGPSKQLAFGHSTRASNLLSCAVPVQPFLFRSLTKRTSPTCCESSARLRSVAARSPREIWYGPCARSFPPAWLRTRPVVGPFERYGGRTMVQSSVLEETSLSIRAKSAYGLRRIQRTKLIKIQGRRPSMAETLTVTRRRTP